MQKIIHNEPNNASDRFSWIYIEKDYNQQKLSHLPHLGSRKTTIHGLKRIRKRHLVMTSFCLICCFSGFFILYEFTNKIALVFYPYEDPPYPIFTIITQRGINLLRSYGFIIKVIDSTPQIPRIIANQVVVFYAGHGIAEYAIIQIRSGEQIPLKVILDRITASQMVLLTSACFGGNWLAYADPGRIIISAVNDTEGYIRAWKTPDSYLDPITPTLATFLELCNDRSIETSYTIWMQQLVEHYSSFQFSYTPVMFDGITGDTYIA
ncbi:MAG: hypothetical protein ACE5R6_19925 [Candidatus Heimdallarchaeota archaeon]